MERISIAFSDNYRPILDQVDALANELRISSSFIILDIVCEAFDFTPAKEPILYKKRSKKN
jgi:hypothetical protein